MLKKLLLVLMLAMVPCFAHSASFDCAKAATDTEKMICNFSELSELDSKLGTFYKEALASAQNKEELRASQREWIKQRNEITDPQKMQGFYQVRIEQLLDGSLVVATPATESAPVTEKPKVTESTKPVPDNRSENSRASDTETASNNTTAAKKELNLSGSTILTIIFVLLIAVVTTYSNWYKNAGKRSYKYLCRLYRCPADGAGASGPPGHVIYHYAHVRTEEYSNNGNNPYSNINHSLAVFSHQSGLHL